MPVLPHGTTPPPTTADGFPTGATGTDGLRAPVATADGPRTPVPAIGGPLEAAPTTDDSRAPADGVRSQGPAVGIIRSPTSAPDSLRAPTSAPDSLGVEACVAGGLRSPVAVPDGLRSPASVPDSLGVEACVAGGLRSPVAVPDGLRSPASPPDTLRPPAPAPAPAPARPPAPDGPRMFAPSPPPTDLHPTSSLPSALAPRQPLPVALARHLLPLALAVILVGALLCVVQQIRSAPYGDHLTPGPAAHSARARGAVVEAYDGRTLRWRYARAGRRPLSVLPARGHAIAVWDDGLVTDTDGRSVRWHRALPAATDWLRRQGGTGVLRPLGRGILAVVTPARIAAYRTADGDLRWVLPARAGCAFRPERAVRHGPTLLVAQPCARGAWTAQLIAVDDLGGIAPHRAPLGNALPGSRPEHPRTEKALAPPR